MLSIKNFTKTYPGGKVAVKDLSLDVNKGDLVAFIGHNGAGKTTTIKAIVGIMPIEEGDILIDGLSVKSNSLECKRMIAYVPDNPDLYESLTGLQYLNLICDIYKISKEKREEKIVTLSTQFGIYDDLNNFISAYSHGMKQKIALIAALAHDPKLLILDEPFVGLDPLAAYTVKNIMRDFCDNGGAIFFSTHILEVAEKLCNKIAIIKEGKLVISGKIEEVIKNESLEDVFLELTENAK
ncbi:MAG: ABC transporter ATP-binding protein [Bacilli bacterium]|nr:ABC transporter ATP-binding protein [Bacilli bacterium]